MAERNQPLNFKQLWPGAFIALAIVAIVFSAFIILLISSPTGSNPINAINNILNDSYLWRVIRFTFYQAFLSTLFSLLPALLLAQALYRQHFPGRNIILRLCSMSLVLPVLVAVFGLLAVYGKQGWLAQLFYWFNIEYNFSLYGLHGILIAHIFFNMPLATRLFLQSLENIPSEQRQISAQLGLTHWQRFRIVELPALQRQILPTAALIFMLCFASFAVVLALGGGPRTTTIELAIYQALRYDFDLARASLLALIQLLCCIGVMLFCQRLSSSLPVGSTQEFYWREPITNKWLQWLDIFLIILALLFILPPLFAVIVGGLNSGGFHAFSEPLLWQAIITSIVIALLSGILTLLIIMALIWSSRELHFSHYIKTAKSIELSSMMILAMPAIVLATGIFLFFVKTVGLPTSAFSILIAVNALMALPYSLKILRNPMYDIAERYTYLCQSLNISGLNRLRIIELKALKYSIAQAMAFACVLSIGDFGVIALFGNDQFFTLPYYLYGQLGAYRSNDAAVTAFVLLLVCFLMFTIIESIPRYYDKNK